MKSLITFLILSTCWHLNAQNITEEQYLKSDILRMKTFESEKDSIITLLLKDSDKKDSLIQELRKIQQVELKQNIDLAIKYASIPSGLQRLFQLRTDIPKETLTKLYKELPSEIAKSEYGRYLSLYLQAKQCEIGDAFYDFEVFDSDGNPNKISNVKSDYILIIYDGLSCFGPNGLAYLKKLHKETDRKKIEFVQYIISKNQIQLKETSNKYKTGFIDVSDFKYNDSPLKIIYGTQTTPTFIIIDKSRKIVFNSSDIRNRKFTEILHKCRIGQDE